MWCQVWQYQNLISVAGRVDSLANPHRAHDDSLGRPEDRAIHPGLRPMQQQFFKYAIQACSFPSLRFFHASLSVDLASSHLQVLTSALSSGSCQDFPQRCPNQRHLLTRIRPDTSVLTLVAVRDEFVRNYYTKGTMETRGVSWDV